MMKTLTGKNALVTGGTRGIGAASARQLAAAGANIAITYSASAEAAATLVRELEALGVKAHAYHADAADPESLPQVVEQVATDLGGIDILVNNAGITQRSAFVETQISVYRRVMEVNFFGSLHCTKAAIDSLIERKGNIIVIESLAGIAPLLGRTG